MALARAIRGGQDSAMLMNSTQATERIALAHRPDFTLGEAVVRPSLRKIDGPNESVALEPRVMQVLLAFVEAGGAVVTRDDLLRECWDGRVVGEDAVNRTIMALRKSLARSGAGVTIETIPRIGYRLDPGSSGGTAASTPRPLGTSRRAAAAAVIGGLALAGGGALWLRRRSDASASAALVEKGRRTLHDGFPDAGTVAARHLAAAVAAAPRNAEAWGLLAFAYRDIAEGAEPETVSTAVRASQEAARRALELDRRQGDALAALATLEPFFGEFAAGEDRIMKALALAPDNFLAMSILVPLLQGVGRVRLSAQWNERAARVDPHSPVPQYRRAIRLWIWNRLEQADQAIDRTLQLWPRHPAVWNARMMMFAYTGRATAGLALLDEERSRPATLKQAAIELWRISLRALASRASADVEAARIANIRAAPRSPGFANTALHNLAMMGEIDAAFDVAFGYFLRRGPLVTTLWGGAGELPVSALRWRRTMALFVPPAAPLRADPRFEVLMEGMGIAEYWRQRRVRPDYQLERS